jgi:hypothetical protein
MHGLLQHASAALVAATNAQVRMQQADLEVYVPAAAPGSSLSL